MLIFRIHIHTSLLINNTARVIKYYVAQRIYINMLCKYLFYLVYDVGFILMQSHSNRTEPEAEYFYAFSLCPSKMLIFQSKTYRSMLKYLKPSLLRFGDSEKLKVHWNSKRLENEGFGIRTYCCNLVYNACIHPWFSVHSEGTRAIRRSHTWLHEWTRVKRLNFYGVKFAIIISLVLCNLIWHEFYIYTYTFEHCCGSSTS
jgi:hypothetical protein